MNQLARFSASNADLNRMYGPDLGDEPGLAAMDKAREIVRNALNMIEEAGDLLYDAQVIDASQLLKWDNQSFDLNHDYFEDDLNAFEDKYRKKQKLPERA